MSRPIEIQSLRFVTAVTILGVATILLLSGLAPASGGSFSVSPPYHGKWSSSNQTLLGGCGHKAIQSRNLMFNLTSGNATLEQRAVSQNPGCRYTVANATALVEFIGATFYVPVGAYHVEINWSISWTVNVSVSPLNASAWPAACAGVEIDGQLVDSAGVKYISNKDWTGGPPCAGMGARGQLMHRVSHPRIYIDATFKAGTYTVETWVDDFVGTYVPSQGGSALASVNVGSFGNHAQLKSIYVS